MMAANTDPYQIPTFDTWSPTATFYHPLQAGSIDGTDLFAHDKGVLRAMSSKYRPNAKVNRLVHCQALSLTLMPYRTNEVLMSSV